MGLSSSVRGFLAAPNVAGGSNLLTPPGAHLFNEMMRNFELQRDKEFCLPCLRGFT